MRPIWQAESLQAKTFRDNFSLCTILIFYCSILYRSVPRYRKTLCLNIDAFPQVTLNYELSPLFLNKHYSIVTLSLNVCAVLSAMILPVKALWTMHWLTWGLLKLTFWLYVHVSKPNKASFVMLPFKISYGRAHLNRIMKTLTQDFHFWVVYPLKMPILCQKHTRTGTSNMLWP